MKIKVLEGDRWWRRPDPQGFWRIWLASAPENARGIRRWMLWVWWTRSRSSRARWRALIKLAATPIAGIKECWSYLGAYGDKVSRVHGISRFRQFVDLVRIRLGAGLSPLVYYKFHLFSPERRGNALGYLNETNQLLKVLLPRLPPTADLGIFEAKRLFEDWCREHDLPTASNLLEVDGNAVVFRSQDPIPPYALFAKPTNWHQGKGAERLRYEPLDGSPRWRTGTGRLLGPDEIEAYLVERSLELQRPFVLQACLVNHPVIRALGNGSLSTLRVMTTRRAPAPAEPLLAVLRVATGNAAADNFDLGGIATRVDLGTGRCGKAIAKRGDYPVESFSINPDNGAQIEGLEVPYWREAVELALRAHSLLDHRIPVIGWDVAILDGGPVLIEANDLPCTDIAQMPTGIPLGKTSYARYIVSELKSVFGLEGAAGRQ